MNRALIVDGLPLSVQPDQLRALFSPYGKVIGAHIPTDNNGQSLGYGYVRMESEEEAIAAVKGSDGAQIENSPIRVVLLSNSPFIVDAQRVLKNNPARGFAICV